MCRRCGEGDKRGNSRDRRARKMWLLSADRFHGDGLRVRCFWQLHDKCPGTLDYATVQVDRLVRGGSYFDRDNIVPSCGPCNMQRFVDDLAHDGQEWPEGCAYGPEVAVAS